MIQDMFGLRKLIAAAVVLALPAAAALAQTSPQNALGGGAAKAAAPPAISAPPLATPGVTVPQGAPGAGKGMGESIAAVVNDEVISTYDLRQRMRLLAFSSGLTLSEQNAAEIAREAMRSLVDERLQMQEIRTAESKQKNFKMQPSAKEVDEELAGLAKQFGSSVPDLMKSLAAAGVDQKTLRDEISAQAAWSRFVQARYQDAVHVGDDQVTSMLERISAAAAKPQYLVSEIFLDNAKVGGQAAAVKGAGELVTQIRGGAPFSAVARQFSSLPTAANGGDAGWLSSGQMQAQLEEALSPLRPGQVAEPIVVQDGVYILQLRDRRAGAGASLVSLKQAAVRLSADATPAQISDAEAKLVALKTAAQDCKELDAEGAKAQGVVVGDLGEANVEELSPEFRKVVDTLKTGEVGGPVRTAAGLHLIGVCARRTGGASEPTRADIENRLYGEQLAMLGRRFLRDLRNSAAIDSK